MWVGASAGPWLPRAAGLAQCRTGLSHYGDARRMSSAPCRPLGLGCNGRMRELPTWEEASYEAVKVSLLASGQLRLGWGVAATASSRLAPKWLLQPMPISAIPRSASSSNWKPIPEAALRSHRPLMPEPSPS